MTGFATVGVKDHYVFLRMRLLHHHKVILAPLLKATWVVKIKKNYETASWLNLSQGFDLVTVKLLFWFWTVYEAGIFCCKIVLWWLSNWMKQPFIIPNFSTNDIRNNIETQILSNKLNIEFKQLHLKPSTAVTFTPRIHLCKLTSL